MGTRWYQWQKGNHIYLRESGKSRQENSKFATPARTANAIPENPCDIDGAASWEPRPKGRLSSRENIDRLIEESPNPWKAFFAITVYGGLRRGEVAELRIEDLVFDQNSPDRIALDIRRSATWISNSAVEVGATKSRAGNRLVWLGPTSGKILREYLEGRPKNADALLFSSDNEGIVHLRESTIRNQVALARKKFGLKESLHRLRDYSLTLYAQQGATLQEIMARGGHSNVQAAMAYQRDAGRDADLAAGMG